MINHSLHHLKSLRWDIKCSIPVFFVIVDNQANILIPCRVQMRHVMPYIRNLETTSSFIFHRMHSLNNQLFCWTSVEPSTFYAQLRASEPFEAHNIMSVTNRRKLVDIDGDDHQRDVGDEEREEEECTVTETIEGALQGGE